MSYQRQLVENAAIGVGVIDHPNEMNLIHKPGVAAVIWRRQPQQGFQHWIENLDPACLPDARLILQASAVSDAALQLCTLAGIPSNKQRNQLIEDISLLAEAFATVMASQYLRLRLEVVTDNACPKFHIDSVKARLICTYRGLGTQYGISTDGKEPRRVFSVPTGSPMLLKGTEWPDQPRSGLLHRSPQIEGTGTARLVLVIDPMDDPTSELPRAS